MINFQIPTGFALRRILKEGDDIKWYVYLPIDSDLNKEMCTVVKYTSSSTEDKIEYNNDVLLADAKTASYK